MAASLEASSAPAANAGLVSRVALSLRQASVPNQNPDGGIVENGGAFGTFLAGQATNPNSNPGTPSGTDASVSTAAPAMDQQQGFPATAASRFPSLLPVAVDLSASVGTNASVGATGKRSLPEHREQDRQQADAATGAVPLVDFLGTLALVPGQPSEPMSSEALRKAGGRDAPLLGSRAADVPFGQAAVAGLASAAKAVDMATALTPAAIEGVTVSHQERHLVVPAPGYAAQPDASKGSMQFPALTAPGVPEPGRASTDAVMAVPMSKPLASPDAGGSEVAASAGAAGTKSASNGLTRGGLATVISSWSTYSKPSQRFPTAAPSPGDTGVLQSFASQISSDAASASMGAVPAFQQVLGAVKDQGAAQGTGDAISGGTEPDGRITTSDPVRVLVVRLHPQDLGEVKVRLTLQEGSISVRVEAQHRSAAELLQAQRSDLVEGLKASGYSVEGVSIHAAADMAAAHNPATGSPSDRWMAAGQGASMGTGANDGGMPRGSSDGSPRGGQPSRTHQNAEPAAAGLSVAGATRTSAKSGVFL